ncbi:hypothetical protein CTI12_AA376460 [Artemisia annua]|uniref:Uncharacterized protein n=1 Tax=Artemisia annua TaxID=35608 RepID=A0A2U1MHX9_ARTAN|nr:hypothetical protein CTI12_AA376460 [Artemisia annua]
MSKPVDEFSRLHSDSDAEESNHEDAVSDNEKPKQQQQLVPVANIKLPILKKEEYDIWAMEMEHYLEYIDNDVRMVLLKCFHQSLLQRYML